MFMDEYTRNSITLLDDDGSEHKFEILDVINNKEGKFYALLPKNNLKSADLNDVYGYYIFEEIENGKDQLMTEVKDESKLKRLSRMFEEKFEEF